MTTGATDGSFTEIVAGDVREGTTLPVVSSSPRGRFIPVSIPVISVPQAEQPAPQVGLARLNPCTLDGPFGYAFGTYPPDRISVERDRWV